MQTASVSPWKVSLASFVFFCLSLFLSSYSAHNPWVVKVGALVFAEAMNPFQSFSRHIRNSVHNVWDKYFSLLEAQQENESLRKQLEVLQEGNLRTVELEQRLARLESLLNASQENRLQGIAAEVIGFGPSQWTQTLMVNKGSTHGVDVGMAVTHNASVVGQVVVVAPHSSTVLLTIDPSSGIDALVQETRARGVLEGSGREWCSLQYVPHEEEVRIGDKVITSGVDNVYPKGLLLGMVSQVEKEGSGLFQIVRVKPAVRFSRLETVFIVQKRE